MAVYTYKVAVRDRLMAPVLKIAYRVGRSSNGRTIGSGPIYPGSNPGLPALDAILVRGK